MRLVLPGVLGTVTNCEPSLGVLDNSVVNVLPPSVEIRIFTLAQLTGAAVVLATFQVTVAVEPALHVIFVFGDVTTNGPDVLVTVTTASVKPVCPIVEPAT